MLAVSGPDVYISPDWYGLDDQVPTWNYIAVHLRGSLTALPIDTLRPHLNALSARNEALLAAKPEWTADMMSEGVMERTMRMILPFRLTTAAVDGTWKLNQNKVPEARAGVIAALGPGGIAEAMKRLTDD